MKIVIQRPSPPVYFAAPSSWVPEPDQAQLFPHIIDAVRCCVDQNLEGADILLLFPRPEFNIRLAGPHRESRLSQV